jgi:hypothetical protein
VKPKVATLNSPVVESMPTPQEVQMAKAYLRGRTFNRAGDIQPLRFAAAAKETRASYPDLLGMIARTYNQGQNEDLQRQIDISNAAKSGR